MILLKESYDEYILSLMRKRYDEKMLSELYFLSEGEVADKARASYSKWKAKLKEFKQIVIAKTLKKGVSKELLKSFLQEYFYLISERGRTTHQVLMRLNKNNRFSIIFLILNATIMALELSMGGQDPLLHLNISHALLDFLHLGFEYLAHYTGVIVPSLENLVI